MRKFHELRRRHPKHRISILVPFRSDHGGRERVWKWLQKYWENYLPEAEIIIGRDKHSHKHPHLPFSKTVAINDAFRRSTGDIIVILDADAYVPVDIIRHCAKRIRLAREVGDHLWFVPYQTILRLTEEFTEEILEGPSRPLPLPPPCPPYVEDCTGSLFGHKFGAMIQIMPREAFLEVGGMDPRFRGWGGEDVCFLRAVDCLYGRHKTVPTTVLHLWHPKFHAGDPKDQWKTRIWEGQDTARVNEGLALRYDACKQAPYHMRVLVDEGLLFNFDLS